ncbi:MAG: BrnT family toxin [Ignavibacteria bacterium]|nr:BrnT family toxin [Ignavibacteria bacterium]
MNFIWDESKNKKLKEERGISFEEVASLILQNKYVEVVKHPKLTHQKIFLVPVHNYIHAIPFLIDEEKNVVLKTIYPSRKFNKLYGQKAKENKT